MKFKKTTWRHREDREFVNTEKQRRRDTERGRENTETQRHGEGVRYEFFIKTE